MNTEFFTTIVVLLLTGLGWVIGQQMKKITGLEEQLQDDRIEIYNAILEPFIILLTSEEAFKDKKIYQGRTKLEIFQDRLLSLEYRQTAFKLSLIGSDEVVSAYNDIMQFFYHNQNQIGRKEAEKTQKVMYMLGSLLLAIRRSAGNQRTKLDAYQMLEWLIKDINDFRPNEDSVSKPAHKKRT